MTIDDAWRDWRNQQQPKPRRRYIDRRIPVAQLDMTEARRWWIPKHEAKR